MKYDAKVEAEYPGSLLQSLYARLEDEERPFALSVGKSRTKLFVSTKFITLHCQKEDLRYFQLLINP
jgi:hypothetical protein